MAHADRSIMCKIRCFTAGDQWSPLQSQDEICAKKRDEVARKFRVKSVRKIKVESAYEDNL